MDQLEFRWPRGGLLGCEIQVPRRGPPSRREVAPQAVSKSRPVQAIGRSLCHAARGVVGLVVPDPNRAGRGMLQPGVAAGRGGLVNLEPGPARFMRGMQAIAPRRNLRLAGSTWRVPPAISGVARPWERRGASLYDVLCRTGTPGSRRGHPAACRSSGRRCVPLPRLRTLPGSTDCHRLTESGRTMDAFGRNRGAV